MPRLLTATLFAVLVGLLMPPTALAADLRIDDSFPAAVRADLLAVANDCLAVVAERFGGEPPAGERPIVLFVREAGPIADSTSDPAVYRIGITVTGRQYAQFVYQLAHELGHVYLEPRRTNGLLETLAVAVSLQALDDMAARWRKTPPHAHWRDYAEAFTRYRTETEASHLKRFPDAVQKAVAAGEWSAVTLYLRYRRTDQDGHAEERDLNVLGGIALRPTLDSERQERVSVTWANYRGIGSLTNPPPGDNIREFRRDLEIDLSQVSVEVKQDLLRLGRGRAALFTAATFTSMPDIKGDGFVFAQGDEWIWLAEHPSRLRLSEVAARIETMGPAEFEWRTGSR